MDGEEDGEQKFEKPFYVDRAKTGRAGCKKCKQKIAQGELRMGKLGYNPFSSGTMKYWHHVRCMFEVFSKQRKTTKRIDSFSEVDGWDLLPDADKKSIKEHFDKEELAKIEANTAAEANTSSAQPQQPSKNTDVENKDNSFRAFRKICSELTNASSYLTKTSIVKEFFEKGSNGKTFTGDIQLWCKSLLPMAAKKVYNLQSKQLVKIFSDIFRTDQEAMLEDLEKGDVAETIGNFFEHSSKVAPAKKAVLMLQEVDSFLDHLAKLTRETDQIDHFKSILPKCTTNDLKIIIRLIKHDLRINAGPKHILEALDPKAYPAFQASRDLEKVVDSVMKAKKGGNASGSSTSTAIKVGINLMTPVLPMLAEACSSVEMAFKKCPNGMYSELKYDGERVQLHKQGDVFKYFSRSLKPVMPHKVRHFEKYIPEAFPHGKDLILDSEILMVDTNTSKPLPFGTLGAHKKAEYKDACVCLFVFDCIYYNGESLIDRPIKERRKILQENMKEITHRVVFSDIEEIHEREDLEAMMVKVFREGLEGLVLKPLQSKYEPGKRHWLKVKKDYLAGGTMADSADLVVLGAWFGTGKKGGIMSVFLMGCYDEKRRRWVTVTKVHGGHDDKTLDALQKQLKMEKISRDAARVPSWLNCAKTMVPDFVAADPKKSQVWEISGAEFTCNQVHTADGISIRFPRVTKIRDDKNWEAATSLAELKQLYNNSKDTSNFSLTQSSTSQSPAKKDTTSSMTPEKKADVSSPKIKNIELNGSEEGNSGKAEKRKSSKDSREPSDERNRKRSKDEPSSSSKKEKMSRDGSDEGRRRSKSPKRSTDERSSDEKSRKGDSSRRKERKRSEESSSPQEKRSRESSKRSRTPDRSRKDSSQRDKSKELSRSRELSPRRRSDEHKHGREEQKDDRKRDDRRKDEHHSKERSDHERSAEKNSQGTKRKSEESPVASSKRARSSSEERIVVKKDVRIKTKIVVKKDVRIKAKELFSDSGSETEVDEDPMPTANVAIAMKNRLPDVFLNHVILLHEDVPDSALLKRYVIAYGGHIYDESKKNCLANGKKPATHVVYAGSKVRQKLLSGDVRHVSVDWLWTSIKEQKTAAEKEFRVHTE